MHFFYMHQTRKHTPLKMWTVIFLWLTCFPTERYSTSDCSASPCVWLYGCLLQVSTFWRVCVHCGHEFTWGANGADNDPSPPRSHSEFESRLLSSVFIPCKILLLPSPLLFPRRSNCCSGLQLTERSRHWVHAALSAHLCGMLSEFSSSHSCPTALTPIKQNVPSAYLLKEHVSKSVLMSVTPADRLLGADVRRWFGNWC